MEPLAARLIDEDPGVREQAAWALGLRGDRRAMAPLTSATSDRHPQVRDMAIWAIGMLNVDADPAVDRALTPNLPFGEAVADALRVIHTRRLDE